MFLWLLSDFYFQAWYRVGRNTVKGLRASKKANSYFESLEFPSYRQNKAEGQPFVRNTSSEKTFLTLYLEG